MIGNISSALSSISRGIATAVRSSSFSVSPQKVSLTPVKIYSPFSPGNSSLSATRLFTAQNSPLVSGSSRSASLHQPATGGGSAAQPLPDVAQRLIRRYKFSSHQTWFMTILPPVVSPGACLHPDNTGMVNWQSAQEGQHAILWV